jgi:hypothetical protein
MGKWSVKKTSQIIQTDSIHYQIISFLKKNLPASEDFSELDDYNKCMVLFGNFRIKHGKPTGLKLTVTGKSMLSKFFTRYEYTLTEPNSLKILLALDRQMTWPYYLTSQRVIFFSQADAALFRLSGGEMNSYISCI